MSRSSPSASPQRAKKGRYAKKIRPSTLPAFRLKGFPSFDARNFIRGYIMATQDVYSWRDFSTIFNTSVRTLGRICDVEFESKSDKIKLES